MEESKLYTLPPIYERNGKECYLDVIRKRLIYITPEETVRQKVINYLINELKVPCGIISVEQHLSHYGINTKKRADIVIHKLDEKGDLHPVAIVKLPMFTLMKKPRIKCLNTVTLSVLTMQC